MSDVRGNTVLVNGNIPVSDHKEKKKLRIRSNLTKIVAVMIHDI